MNITTVGIDLAFFRCMESTHGTVAGGWCG
jgi:hypothetical protein